MYAVILAGGSGTRFWPKSRETRPKQLLSLSGSASLLRQTVDRIRPLVPHERILIVAGTALEDGVREALPELPSENLILEPVGRNTAPAIGLGALILRRRNPDAVMAVLPADHVVQKEAELLRVLQRAAEIVRDHPFLVTLGIQPTRAETGYGYIEQGALVEPGAYRVQCFTEKPDTRTAEAFLRTGRFSWNSGMFVWKASDILAAMQAHCPETHRDLQKIDGALGTQDEAQVLRQVYEEMPAESIDYAVMEKARDIVVIPVDLGWSDVGSWRALEEVLPQDAQGNTLRGQTVLRNTSNSIVVGEKRLIAAVGVNDLIVVETDDAVLVCHKDKAQEVRQVVELLRVRGLDQYL